MIYSSSIHHIHIIPAVGERQLPPQSMHVSTEPDTSVSPAQKDRKRGGEKGGWGGDGRGTERERERARSQRQRQQQGTYTNACTYLHIKFYSHLCRSWRHRHSSTQQYTHTHTHARTYTHTLCRSCPLRQCSTHQHAPTHRPTHSPTHPHIHPHTHPPTPSQVSLSSSRQHTPTSSEWSQLLCGM